MEEGARIDSLLARWDASKELAKHGVSFLLWGLLDDIVDGHFEAVQSLDSEIEALEDLLFDDAPRNTEVQRRSFEFRKSLVLLRRVVLPMREVVNSLMRRDLHVLDEGMTPYYQDVYDHVLRGTEWTESLRDLVSTILETNLMIQGNRMNLVMKKVTSWAAIIAVPTAITGFYGQNVPYPVSRIIGDSGFPRRSSSCCRVACTGAFDVATGSSHANKGLRCSHVLSAIGFLHTAEIHVETFSALLDDFDPARAREHAVRPDLLDRAREYGLEDEALGQGLLSAFATCAGAMPPSCSAPAPHSAVSPRDTREMPELRSCASTRPWQSLPFAAAHASRSSRRSRAPLRLPAPCFMTPHSPPGWRSRSLMPPAFTPGRTSSTVTSRATTARSPSASKGSTPDRGGRPGPGIDGTRCRAREDRPPRARSPRLAVRAALRLAPGGGSAQARCHSMSQAPAERA